MWTLDAEKKPVQKHRLQEIRHMTIKMQAQN